MTPLSTPINTSGLRIHLPPPLLKVLNKALALEQVLVFPYLLPAATLALTATHKF